MWAVFFVSMLVGELLGKMLEPESVLKKKHRCDLSH